MFFFLSKKLITGNILSILVWSVIFPSLSGTFKSNPDEEIKAFRTNMKKAYEGIMKGNDPATINKFIVEAVSEGGKDPSIISRSLLGKRLWLKSKIAPGKNDLVYTERLNNLRKRIGNKAYNRLLRHDELIDMYAELFTF